MVYYNNDQKDINQCDAKMNIIYIKKNIVYNL